MKFHNLIAFASFLFLFCFCHDVFATQYCLEGYERPDWVHNFAFDGSLENSKIEVLRGEGSSTISAEQTALQKIISNKALASGQVVFTIASNGDIVSNNSSLRVKAHVLDRCTEDRGNDYFVSLLVQTAKKPDYDYDNVYVSSHYEFSGRVFVPGMAQIYKGQNVKGALFITGETLFIAGIATSFGMRSYFKSKKISAKEGDKKTYEDWSRDAWYAGWAFVGAAAALYIINIIDGIAVTEGEKAVFANGKKIALTPYAAPKSIGLAMNVNF